MCGIKGEDCAGGGGGVGMVVRVVGGEEGGWEIGDGWMSDEVRMLVRE